MQSELEGSVTEICLARQAQIPPSVIRNNKIVLRLAAERAGIPAPRAYLVNLKNPSGRSRRTNLPILSMIHPTPFCRGYSVILLHPARLHGKVIRFFARRGRSTWNRRAAIDAHRSKTTAGLTESVINIVGLVPKRHRILSIIIQEILDPEYEGVIRRIQGNYLLEVGQGHFVTKAVIPLSTYVLGPTGSILYSRQARQRRMYRITDGQVTSENIRKAKTQLGISKSVLRELVDRIACLLFTKNTTLEFAVVRDPISENLIPFVLDFIEEKSKQELDLRDIQEGVISKGTITGRVRFLHIGSNSFGSLDLHFYDHVRFRGGDSHSNVLLCRRPDIGLLGIIREYHQKKIGFVFKEGSFLCHLSIILREMSIPAIYYKPTEEIAEGQPVRIDAVTKRLNEKDRLILVYPRVLAP